MLIAVASPVLSRLDSLQDSTGKPGMAPRGWTVAKVAELADALDLGSSPARGGGSTPPFRTIIALLEDVVLTS